MNGAGLILMAMGAMSLVVLVGQHTWTLPRWLPPLLLFVGFGGVLGGMGLITLALIL